MALDFVRITTRPKKTGVEVYPKFIIKRTSKDLMIRGGDFYAIWDEESGLWSTDEQIAIDLIDSEIRAFVEKNKEALGSGYSVLYMWDADSGIIDKWHKYCQKQMRDNFHALDDKLIFSNMDSKRDDYASHKLSYPLEKTEIKAYDTLMSTLYSPEERHKIEWAIGSIVNGDSKYIQKFIVLYGAAGTGKSTVLNIIQELFDGYFCVFDAKALGSANNTFALEAFRTNPLVAIQHDGDLSRIEDNTRLNSLISHEIMTVNEKFKATYANRFRSFLFMGTNKPVKITDAKSGLIRRLIDVSPTGEKLKPKAYNSAVNKIKFELGGIALHCKEVYEENPHYYDNYIPVNMLGATNVFYDFILDNYDLFEKQNMVSLKQAWELYKQYCDDAKVPYPFPKGVFREELKNYFCEFYERYSGVDGGERHWIRNVYYGFIAEKFTNDNFEQSTEEAKHIDIPDWLKFTDQTSVLDKELKDCPAQYAVKEKNGTIRPMKAWDNVTTKLSDLDTSKLHYVQPPVVYIVTDFDWPDPQTGEKSRELNLEKASEWPETYGEYSQSGNGVHLHYIYEGEHPEDLLRIVDEHTEIKVYTGKSALRRKVTYCNNHPIAKISSGLKLKEKKKGNVLSSNIIKSETMLRSLISRNLKKEFMGYTEPSVSLIYKTLEDAYNNPDLSYDLSDMIEAVQSFALDSTHQADKCLKMVKKMHFVSKDREKAEINVTYDPSKPIVIFDCEVFPNLFLICWKLYGKGQPVYAMFNPTPAEVAQLFEDYNMIGFNNKNYDNNICYGRIMGLPESGLFDLSQRIIAGDKDAKFPSAYGLSYSDVYDFAAAGHKKSLKKFEIELGITHHELNLPWWKPVPKELWEQVADYCKDDVIATEATFDHLSGDWAARKILAELAGMTPNASTNQLSARIIFQGAKNPQHSGVFNWRDMSKPVGSDQYEEYKRKFGDDYKFRVWNEKGLPVYRDYIPGEDLPKGWSILPFFPGYKFEKGVSTYLGETIGEGGKVYAEPGMYYDVDAEDVTSMHPHSAYFEMIFGPEYTKRFYSLVDGRIHIKHEDWDAVSKMFGGKLAPYVEQIKAGTLNPKDLSTALKTVINSVYGLTSAHFDNPFRDSRNIDNIVAKRGALFMTLLKKEVQNRGFKVCHIKTDCIKIPNATPEIVEFVHKFGAEYGYSFEQEHHFIKFCLVNDAVYVGKADESGKPEWVTVGTQFKVPYVRKKLFTHEDIVFDDLCETKSVSKGSIYLDMNENLPDISDLEKEKKKLEQVIGKRLLDEHPDLDKKDPALKTLIANDIHIKELNEKIEKGHNRVFVGRVGRFTPVIKGGGLLVRSKDEDETQFSSVSGSIGWRWLESEVVKEYDDWADCIDYSYYDTLVTDAIDTINKYGDCDEFVA